MDREQRIIETALFAAGGAVGLNQLSALIGTTDEDTSRIADDLIEEYSKRESGIEIVRLESEFGVGAEGESKSGSAPPQTRYLMRIKSEYAECVRSLAPKELPAPVLRTLSMIAYHQPVAQSDLVKARGNSAYSHVRTLLDLRLITSVPKGHTRLLMTTPGFAEYFGMDADDPEAVRSVLSAKMASRIGVTPMYESLMGRCGIPYVVVNAYNPSANDLALFGDIRLLVISKGYTDKVKQHFSGEIIEIASATFDDLIGSLSAISRYGKKRDVSKVLSELEELKERYHERSRKLNTKLEVRAKPATEMAAHILNDLGFAISQTGILVAPDYLGIGDITFPTHKDAPDDVIARICARYDAILDSFDERVRNNTGLH